MQIPMRMLATALALLASSSSMAIEEPRFEVIERDGAFGLRDYAPHLLAETQVEAGFTVAFVVPAKYSLDTVPRPTDPGIRMPASTGAARCHLARFRPLDHGQLSRERAEAPF
jgi:hypothetical protein